MDDSKRGKDISDKIKKEIVKRFFSNVKGKSPDTSTSNVNHDGKDGHWLETQMGVSHNASNTPDIEGFEMKNDTTTKTTFGDWSPKHKIYKKGNEYKIDRDMFLEIFGAPNAAKNNRYSWSGKPCPKVGSYNSFGQKLVIDDDNNILAIYSFKEDQRTNKDKIVPKIFQQENLILAKWDADTMKVKVERKFNNRGWFKCVKENGVYTKIVFGLPINFETWIDGVKKSLIFFDSGMYAGNKRPYSQWRASNKYWESLVTETY